ncbi:hypothetical protein [Lacticaseibacillus thailandensis]|uniref:hypothetical protein n=1 Tax=Lacticaseibacillus thailandensis TaxID=381741 RepID=UPI0007053B49|nr:hypothetical protein [Lacticaseibacillus thailandensis]
MRKQSTSSIVGLCFLLLLFGAVMGKLARCGEVRLASPYADWWFRAIALVLVAVMTLRMARANATPSCAAEVFYPHDVITKGVHDVFGIIGISRFLRKVHIIGSDFLFVVQVIPVMAPLTDNLRYNRRIDF